MTLYSENIMMEKPLIEIEYCTKCRWLARVSWIAQELLSTFSSEIGGVTLIPSEIAGIFEIRCGRKIIWERGKKKGMPEIKLLKQNVRDIIAQEDNIEPSYVKAVFEENKKLDEIQEKYKKLFEEHEELVDDFDE